MNNHKIEVLQEGGFAAADLAQSMKSQSGSQTEYRKISQQELPTIFETEIETLITGLKTFGIIPTDFQPSFNIGSTRLAAHIVGKPVELGKFETEDVINQAKHVKKYFGDIDVDIVLDQDATLDDVMLALEKMNREKTHSKYKSKKAAGEVNVAVVLDGTDDVIQIDLIDVSNNSEYKVFNQYSSINDIANGVKGFFQNILLSSVVSNLVLGQGLKTKAENNVPNTDVDKWKTQGYRIEKPMRMLLGKNGLRVVQDMAHDEFNTKKVTILDTLFPDMDLNSLSQVILGSSEATLDNINSSCHLSEYIAQNRPEMVQNVWNSFIGKLKHGTNCDREDVMTAVEVIGSGLGISPDMIRNELNGIFKVEESFRNYFRLEESLMKKEMSPDDDDYEINYGKDAPPKTVADPDEKYIYTNPARLCPDCGGTTIYHGDPEKQTMWRGSAKCGDCSASYSSRSFKKITNESLKGPELVVTDKLIDKAKTEVKEAVEEHPLDDVMDKKVDDDKEATPKIFLGGTCADSTWRSDLIELLDIAYFDPVVDDWTPECQKEEVKQRETCAYCLYVITPKMKGVYSIAEVVDDSNKRPERCIFCSIVEKDDKEFTKEQAKSLEEVAKMVTENGGKVCKDLKEIADFVNKKSLNESVDKKKVKTSIKRFSGANELSEKKFQEVLNRLESVVPKFFEKVDGSPCSFGLTDNKFFLRSTSSDKITRENLETFNNSYTKHFYEAFKYLLPKLETEFQTKGTDFEIFSEMLFKTDDNQSVFSSMDYKLEDKATFIIFDNPGITLPDIDGVKLIDNAELEVYARYVRTFSLITRSSSSDIRDTYQDMLNRIANETESKFGGGPVEGVIMDIDGILIKGTSEAFDTRSKQVWTPVKKITDFKNNMCKEVFELVQRGVSLDEFRDIVSQFIDNFDTVCRGLELDDLEEGLATRSQQHLSEVFYILEQLDNLEHLDLNEIKNICYKKSEPESLEEDTELLTELFVNGTGNSIIVYKENIWLFDTLSNEDVQNIVSKLPVDSEEFVDAEYDDIEAFAYDLQEVENSQNILVGRIDNDTLVLLRSAMDFHHSPESSHIIKKVVNQLGLENVVTSDEQSNEKITHKSDVKGELPKYAYHGTSIEGLQGILKRGLRPNPEKTNFENIEHEDHVFLTTSVDKAIFHAVTANENMKNLDSSYTQPIIIKFEVPDLNQMVPDFDIDKTGDGETYQNIDSKNVTKSDDIKPERFSKDTGIYGYRGNIPSSFIKEVWCMDKEMITGEHLSSVEFSEDDFSNVHGWRNKKSFLADLDEAEELGALQYVDLQMDMDYVLDDFRNEELEESTQNTPEKWVIPGRFQPFTKGHNEMLQAVQNNAVIVIVKGRKTSQDKDRNPLEFSEQTSLIKAIHPDVQVLRCESGYLPEVLNVVQNAGINPLGIVCGTDRYEEYRGQLQANFPTLDIKCIERSEQALSASEARSKARSKPRFENWFDEFAVDSGSVTKYEYKKVFNKFSTSF